MLFVSHMAAHILFWLDRSHCMYFPIFFYFIKGCALYESGRGLMWAGLTLKVGVAKKCVDKKGVARKKAWPKRGREQKGRGQKGAWPNVGGAYSQSGRGLNGGGACAK